MTKKIVRLLAPIVIAVVLGPLIAGLAVTLFAVVHSLLYDTGGLSLADLKELAVFYIIFAYVIGGAIALLAGILVSIWMIWYPPCAIVATAAAVIATIVYMGIGALGVLGPVDSSFLFTLVFAVIAANGCWLLMRRFARRA
jgi:energy-converting hydrogenase Eha subunit F